MELKKGFITPDGKVFDTAAEARDYMRSPLIKAALNKLTEGNAELTDWLLENRDVVEDAFDTGVIRRVSKSEKKQLEKAVEAIKEFGKSHPESSKPFAFIVEHADVIKEVFRWPTVTRMTDEEKANAARATLVKESEGNEELADWVLANKDALLACFEAGKEKREMNPKAAEALAAYRAKKAAEKEAADTAKS
jgi:dsDNA-binding SOS-regulon protein